MADDLTVAIERLRTSTQRLNAICDAAAQSVRDIEVFLEKSHIGVAAWVEFKRVPEDEEGRHYTSVTLSYCRMPSGKFRIAIASAPPWVEHEDDITVRPWVESSRDEKLESFEKLPALLAELAKRVDERTAKAEKLVSAVNDSLPLPKKRKGG